MRLNDALLLAAVLGVGYIALRMASSKEAGVQRALFNTRDLWNPLNGAPLRGNDPAGTFDYWRV